MPESRTDALREAYRLIFDHEPPSGISDGELMKLVAEGFSVERHGVELARRCLLEIHCLQDGVCHEDYSYAHEELYQQLTAHHAVGAL